MKTCITRIWHGMTRAEHADSYLSYIEETGIRDYRNTAGNLSVQIWRRIEGNQAHFWTVTTWDSYESIRKFAGDEIEKANYYDRDKEFLLAFEPNVIHCETFQY